MPRPKSFTVLGPLLGPLLVAAGVSFSGVTSAAPKEEDTGFDRQAAASALSSIELQKCKAPGAKKGEGHIMVTFAPAGAVTTATLDKGPMVGTPVQRCIEGQFKKAKVPAFKGGPVQVGKSFRFE